MKLREINLKGYKSIDGDIGQTIPLGDVTVLLGANGSGKSNLVSFFKMLNFMTAGAFQQYVGRQGDNRLLFYGSKQTESISFNLKLESDAILDRYEVNISYGIPDRLFISGEKVVYHKVAAPSRQLQEYSLKSGDAESGLGNDPSQISRAFIAFYPVFALISFTTRRIPQRSRIAAMSMMPNIYAVMPVIWRHF